ncbi:CDP-glycerol glycerophosphotransferase family protein [Staphylococcus lugdunensis]|uniref:teichoic acid glycerol-phosphate primase TarB n=1 Tax=Staphylococcus lugdunensis TaxID=28035 RepID=UPI001F4CA21F|nr:teichoic acid glycerol-phosphate primase TarB [Staphylococcus lugdunensis]MCH8657802.1 CDP-glycerol glycerophosphotransferase family protein [Staphylococcus lugdunensis]MCH8668134.1 CDP-glycerol glycerophosphotransferase family protein [Staphylococcus lugdunensis]
MRILIKKLYMAIIRSLNMLFFPVKVNKQHIVVFMTFYEDMMPIIKALVQQSYQITVIGPKKYQQEVESLGHLNYLIAGNKGVIQHIKALSSARVILIDTYYLMLGGYRKKRGQTIIQTWHASGALKLFGLQDHQVDTANTQMVTQYKKVYDATDYYLIGGEEMGKCFEGAFDAQAAQMLKFGLPRLVDYQQQDMIKRQRDLKQQHGITKKLIVYVPTYREDHGNNRKINSEKIEQALPEYCVISQFHPSIVHQSSGISTQELLIMADVLISDYSSLPIEASLLHKPTLFYVYDETEYHDQRGLNQFYWTIPEVYKVTDEAEIINKLKNDSTQLKPLFESWHDYNSTQSLMLLMNFIDKLVKK